MPPVDPVAGGVRPKDTVNAAAPPDRRTFVKGVGWAVLTVQCLPMLACAADPSAPQSEDAHDSLKILSSAGKFGHVHNLLVPLALLTAPPVEGVALTTSKAFLHQHHVTLTQDDLARVHRGGTVTQKASSHIFVIALAKGSADPHGVS